MHKEYYKAAKDLESKHNHIPSDENGPVKSALLSFGPTAGKYEETVLGLGIGCFGELSAGIIGVFSFIARNARSCGVFRRSLQRQVAQGVPWNVSLKDSSRDGSLGE